MPKLPKDKVDKLSLAGVVLAVITLVCDHLTELERLLEPSDSLLRANTIGTGVLHIAMAGVTFFALMVCVTNRSARNLKLAGMRAMAAVPLYYGALLTFGAHQLWILENPNLAMSFCMCDLGLVLAVSSTRRRVVWHKQLRVGAASAFAGGSVVIAWALAAVGSTDSRLRLIANLSSFWIAVGPFVLALGTFKAWRAGKMSGWAVASTSLYFVGLLAKRLFVLDLTLYATGYGTLFYAATICKFAPLWGSTILKLRLSEVLHPVLRWLDNIVFRSLLQRSDEPVAERSAARLEAPSAAGSYPCRRPHAL